LHSRPICHPHMLCQIPQPVHLTFLCDITGKLMEK
jgi:hypothetical protein